jgi:hypothetical protein
VKIEARFYAKAPEETSDVERLMITHGDLVLEISLSGTGLRLRLDEPLGDALTVFPHASNTIVLHASRQEDVK